MTNKELKRKYAFPGTTVDNSFFKTEEDKKSFIKEVGEAIRKSADELEKMRRKSGIGEPHCYV